MPSYSTVQREGRLEFSHWDSLSAEVLSFCIQHWLNVAEIQAGAFLAMIAVAPALPTETPPDRRRKFTVIEGGKT
jgi:hypothetical protein